MSGGNNNDLKQIVSEIQKATLKDVLYLSEELPRRLAEAIAGKLAQTELKFAYSDWIQFVSVDLTNARNNPEPILELTERATYLLYMPDSTGTGTIYFDTPMSHAFAIGTTWELIPYPFKKLFLTNTAQAGMYLYLLAGRGDISILKNTMSPMDLQAQYRPVIASTTTALGANNTYTSDWYDMQNYGRLTLLFASNVASATDGVKIQQSPDETNADYESAYSTTSQTIDGTTKHILAASIEMVARYARIKYTNGVGAQSWFRLTARARVV